jgi:acetoin utilization deacetylase AcuC-like enzyme
MKKVGYVYHKDFLKHTTDRYHPENPQRLKAIDKAITDSGLIEKLTIIEPKPAQPEDIQLIHTEKYFQIVKSTQDHPLGDYDADTYYCRHTYTAAMLAVGGVLQAGQMLMDGKIDCAFCAVRPPGHHAEADHAMGFCFFNNIAILAKWLLQNHNLKRIAIIDWDGHHGNGTQHAFYASDDVHFCSLHLYPFFPGTGKPSDIGTGEGESYNLNLPMAYGSDDEVFLRGMRHNWVPAMVKFKPEILLISAGYDGYCDDPLVPLEITRDAYQEATRTAKRVADKYCQGRIISVLEGGYNMSFLGQAVIDHLNILME